MSLILAAHQPSYLPWLGYLDKLAKADVFVLMDDLQYEAQNFQNRNRVKLNHGTAWLTVPLASGTQSDRICDKRIQNQASPKEHWQRRSWVTLETHYRRAPFFADYADELRDVYTRPWETLVELNAHMLELARKWLCIDTPIVKRSELGLEGYKTERILDMCNKLGATSYLAAAAARRATSTRSASGAPASAWSGRASSTRRTRSATASSASSRTSRSSTSC